MKRLIIATFLAAWLCAPLTAKNNVQTVKQVDQAITLNTDVDYHISSDAPFVEGGSINITNTEHAVVIFDALRPSLAKAFLTNITINGAAARDGSNCQLKLYNRGAILLPYGGSSFRPLTVFDEPNFGGESYNNFTEGHNGNGFMKNVDTKWNNRIKSFKLKRGYMVTFALGDTGKGYSRCFIAADEDLEMTLPAILANRITSYRLFKWYDASKVALANDTRANSVALLNVTSCYSFGKGESRLPDAECIPHHIYENWPSAEDCGNQSYSCHLKTNNEPGNSADDHPQDVATILNNWENLMRTGLRLCSPSSHDGSLGHLRACLDSIDARGWRCDIIDLHCYWPESSFNTWSFYDQWANRYGRPIWISEWVWGASWNNNGAFVSGVTETQNRDAVRRITTNLNSWDCIERYFYWNSERDPSKVIRNDGTTLTPTGLYYATINSGLAYKNYGNYVPRTPRTYAPDNLKVSLNASNMTARVSFTLKNGELSDSVAIMRSSNSGKTFEKVQGYSFSEIATKTNLTYNDPIPGGGTYVYKIVEIDVANRTMNSEEVSLVVSGTEKSVEGLQFGTVTSTPGETMTLLFSEAYNEYPVLIGGSASYFNTGTGSNAKGIVNNYVSSGKVNGLYATAIYRENPWVKSDGTTVNITKEESTNVIVGQSGNGTIGKLHYEMGFVPKVEGESGYIEGSISYDNAKTLSNLNEEVREVKFRQPFAQTPVVMVTPLTLSTGAQQQLTMWRIWDVTNEGFKVQLLRQKGNTASNNNVFRVCYLAMEQGQDIDGTGHVFTVGTQEAEFASATQEFQFDYEATNPRMMAQLQTDYQLTERETQTAAILRLSDVKSNSAKVVMQVDVTHSAMWINSSRKAIETIGFINISDDPHFNPDAIDAVTTSTNIPDGVYTLTGIRLNHPNRPGIYVVGGKKILVK